MIDFEHRIAATQPLRLPINEDFVQWHGLVRTKIATFCCHKCPGVGMNYLSYHRFHEIHARCSQGLC